MRYVMLFWALPMGFIWAWYFLSFYDVAPGSLYFTREFHDLVFQIYGQVLGIDPATIPPLLARACIVDTALIFGILAFRRRAAIRSWWQNRKLAKAVAQEGNLPNLSNAP
ncbi:MAG: DUF6105 family protein [Rhizobiaceae bacterium]